MGNVTPRTVSLGLRIVLMDPPTTGHPPESKKVVQLFLVLCEWAITFYCNLRMIVLN